MAPADQRPRRLQINVQRSATRLRAPGLATWLTSNAPAAARGEVTVVLVSDSRIRELNRRYRGQDHVTDVLSFPTEPASARRPTPRAQRPRPSVQRPVSSAQRPTPSAQYLGDIVIAAGLAARQAREAGHSVSTEVRILALHGLLHLVGYDHERASDRGCMVRLEKRLRARGGLPEGLIERGDRR